MSATTFERVQNILAAVIDAEPDEVEMDVTFDDLAADSLDAVEIAMACETEFDIDLPDDKMLSYRTVGDLVRGVDAALAARPSEAGSE